MTGKFLLLKLFNDIGTIFEKINYFEMFILSFILRVGIKQFFP